MLTRYGRRRKNLGFLGHDSSALTPQQQQERRQLRYELDLNSFNWKIWGVAASGFLTDSYNLFATNVILTSLAFVYWPDSGVHWQAMLVNVVTLFGSVCGQLAFGALADYYGRTRLYGIELVLMIVSTIGIATNRAEYGSMKFLPPFLWWRFIMGIGVGAEYPLSSVITAEWSSTQSRAKMMAAVFTMQPIGQALAQMVGMWVLLRWNSAYGIDAKQCGLNTLYDDECKQFVDMIWRIVVGSGAIPAVMAIIFRFYLFDSGVYKFDVEDRPDEAMINTYRVYGGGDRDMLGPAHAPLLLERRERGEPGNEREPDREPDGEPDTDHDGDGDRERDRGSQPMPVQFSRSNLRKFFIEDGNYVYLLGTAATWFLLDVTFFGLALDNRATLADMWATKNEPLIDERLPCWESSLEGGFSPVPGWAVDGLPVWQTDGKHPCTTIYDVLFEQAVQYLLAVSVGSILGSLCFVLIVDRVSRRQWLVASFAILAALLFITGIVCYCVFETPRAPATIICLGISLFMFNCGANPLNFIMPAEIFPTCYRCTCHGISAAAGKTGSIMAILLIYVINDTYKSTSRQGLILLLFCAVAALGSVCAWAYLPEVQRHVRVGPRGELVREGGVEAAGGRSRRGKKSARARRSEPIALREYKDGTGNGTGDHKDPSDPDFDPDDDDVVEELDVEERKHLHRNWLTFWREDAMLENETLEELGEGRRRALQEGQVYSIEDRFADLRRRRVWRLLRGRN